MEEELKQFQWLPPVKGELFEVTHYYEKSKGQWRYCHIAEYPDDLSQLLDWISYRKENGYGIIVYRTYLVSKKQPALAIKFFEEQPFIYVSLKDFRIYVSASKLKELRKEQYLVRYLARYGGYKVSTKKLKLK